MKFLHRVEDRFTFQLRPVEKDCLEALLELYPVVEAGYLPAHRLPFSGGQDAGIQQLLTEAQDSHRQECRRELERWLANPERFVPAGKLFRLTLTAAQIEWLLQVLNDVRVGSWVKLGRPDPNHGRPVDITEENARHLWAMEMCGLFQSALLAACG